MTADNVGQRQLRVSVAIGTRYQINSRNCGGRVFCHSLTKRGDLIGVGAEFQNARALAARLVARCPSPR